MNNTMNVKRKPSFIQVCVWPATFVGNDVAGFEEFMMKEFGVRVQYLEEIATYPDIENGEIVDDTGGRNDVFFAVHEDDIAGFAVPRLQVGIRWIEDVLSPHNYKSKIYPERVTEYCTWDA